MTMIQFPDDFVWGVASSAYQIEGAYEKDGRGPSIWDTFCHTPGKIYRGHVGDEAADHYHRYADDVGMMAELGLDAYRFSIAWSRVLPAGKGKVNPKGLDFYDRLVDVLMEQGITPFPTLHHWDLPQALQDEGGGWANRETAYHFAEFARVTVERLGDRVTRWITHNEPFVLSVLGHYTGEHAPGLTDPFATFQVGYHLLLSHGLAVDVLRTCSRQPLEIGITLDYSPMHPATESDEDRQAARRLDGIRNRMFFEPILLGEYPQDVREMLGPLMPEIKDEDLRHMSAPIDFVGLNYYTRTVVRHDPGFPVIAASPVEPEGNEYSMMWEIYPEGMYETITRVWNDYRPPSIYITENGIPVPDDVDHDGQVRDYRRIRYLRDHLFQVHRASETGIPVKGYFHWSLTDNFEWAFGYRMRFGLVFVDFDTQERTIKESGRWYAQVIENKGFDPTSSGLHLPG